MDFIQGCRGIEWAEFGFQILRFEPDRIAVSLFGFEDLTIGYSKRVTFPGGHDKPLKRVTLPKRFNPVRLVLTYSGLSVEVRDLYQDLARVPGAKWAAFRAIVGNPGELEDALSENTGVPLEHAVARTRRSVRRMVPINLRIVANATIAL